MARRRVGGFVYSTTPEEDRAAAALLAANTADLPAAQARVIAENQKRADFYEFKPRTERPRPAYVVLARNRVRDPTKGNPDRWVEQVTVYDRDTAELWAASIHSEHPQLVTRIVPVRGSRRARPHPRRLR